MPFDNPHETPFGDIEILTGARDRISDKDRWTKRRFRDGERHCLVYALSLASGSRCPNRPNRTERRLARLLSKQLWPERPSWRRVTLIPSRQRLMSFNDDLRTNHADVIALFDRAICGLMAEAPAYVAR
jgi:hypothetical protein